MPRDTLLLLVHPVIPRGQIKTKSCFFSSLELIEHSEKILISKAALSTSIKHVDASFFFVQSKQCQLFLQRRTGNEWFASNILYLGFCFSLKKKQKPVTCVSRFWVVVPYFSTERRASLWRLSPSCMMDAWCTMRSEPACFQQGWTRSPNICTFIFASVANVC